MLMLTKALFKDKFFYVALSITLLVLYLSLIRLRNSPISFSQIDKVEHATAYCFLTFSWLLAFQKKGLSKRTKYQIGFACFFYGIIIEVLQGTLTSYRTASILDVLANTTGIVIAMLIFKTILKKTTLFST